MFISGFLGLPWWGVFLITLGLTHVTIAAVTIYLHRGVAHRALDFHPIASHFFRAWLWLTTGMTTKEWVAVHRKHHAKVDTPEDPHSPQTHGLNKVLFAGVMLYVSEAQNQETLARFGAGTPNDWLERNVYTPYPLIGLVVAALMDMALFGILTGAVVFIVQIAWIPFWAAGVINGIGHFVGYRNFDCTDASRNLAPWGILIGGEELHNNHHAHPTSAKLSFHRHEFDIGWLYIQTLACFGLVTVKKRVSRPKRAVPGRLCSAATLHAIAAHRYSLLREFAHLMKSASAKELRKHDARKLKSTWMRLQSADLRPVESERIEKAYASSPALRMLAQFRGELCTLWDDAGASELLLLTRLNSWCKRAEASDSLALRRFSLTLRQYA
jgi:stearoyl-CoA desaturase (delta-9 desaturase)